MTIGCLTLARAEGVDPHNFSSKSNGLQAPFQNLLDEMLDALFDVFLSPNTPKASGSSSP